MCVAIKPEKKQNNIIFYLILGELCVTKILQFKAAALRQRAHLPSPSNTEEHNQSLLQTLQSMQSILPVGFLARVGAQVSLERAGSRVRLATDATQVGSRTIL